MRSHSQWTLATALALAALLLYWSLQGVRWSELARLIAGANVPLLGFGCTLGAASLLLRSLRWRVLLCAEAHVSRADAFWATTAGYFGNNFLPARAGELVRTFMISSRSRLS